MLLLPESNEQIDLQRAKTSKSGLRLKKDIIIKDHNFYKGNSFLWNKPEILNQKIYNQYHIYNDKNQQRIMNMQKMQEQDQLNLNNFLIFSDSEKQVEQSIKNVNIFRNQELVNLKTRKFERQALQYESQQKFDINLDDKDTEFLLNDESVCKQIITKKSFVVRLSNLAANSWNNFTKHSNKLINQIITPYCLKQDEKAYCKIQDRFQKDFMLEEQKQEYFTKLHDSIRNEFKEKQLANFQSQRDIGLINQGKIQKIVENNQNNCNTSDVFPCRYESTAALIKTSLRNLHQNDSSIDQLSKPHKYKFPEHLLKQHSDYKGLYNGEIDDRKAYQIDNSFVQKILPSSLAQSNVNTLKLSRPGSQNSQLSSSRPKTGLSELDIKNGSQYYKFKNYCISTKNINDFSFNLNSVEQKQIYDEMDNFDKKQKYAKLRRQFGFPSTSLSLAKNLFDKNHIQKKQNEAQSHTMKLVSFPQKKW